MKRITDMLYMKMSCHTSVCVKPHNSKISKLLTLCTVSLILFYYTDYVFSADSLFVLYIIF